jgi:hypothetical protein
MESMEINASLTTPLPEVSRRPVQMLKVKAVGVCLGGCVGIEIASRCFGFSQRGRLFAATIWTGLVGFGWFLKDYPLSLYVGLLEEERSGYERVRLGILKKRAEANNMATAVSESQWVVENFKYELKQSNKTEDLRKLLAESEQVLRKVEQEIAGVEQDLGQRIPEIRSRLIEFARSGKTDW